MTRPFPSLAALAMISSITLAVPCVAQEGDPGPQNPPQTPENDAFRDGFNLLSEGTKLILRGLSDELAPLIEDLGTMIDDLNAYHAPEMLPNGDIILRRKVPLDPDAPGGEVEL